MRLAALSAVVAAGAALAAASTATADTQICTVNSVGGRVVCHSGITSDNLWARPYDSSGFCPSDYYKVSNTGIVTAFATGVCDSGNRGTSNFFCVGCRRAKISIDNNYGVPVGTRYQAWHT